MYNLICREKENFNNTILNELPNELHVYVNVFVALMLNLIFSKLDGSFIVTPKDGWMILLESKL
jgi:hypothetical protein